ncbi:hypothetical protein [Paenibacillus pinihumi]|uniref:hypothetical protein n=1 Tax=Paenibacillus pinihumi TaxID=669462 RepID=UPI00042714B4|nr:hypothetical protein [Paenibacillus pinihumi]
MEHWDTRMVQLSRGARPSESGDLAKDKKLPNLEQQFLEVGGETLTFVTQELMDRRLSMKLPRNFQEMSEEMARIKYPSDRRPQLIFTNETGTVNLAFTHTASPVEKAEVGQFTEVMTASLRKAQKLRKWHGSGMLDTDETTVGYCEFVSPTLEEDIYNLMGFLSMEERALLCTFNCLGDDMKEWQPMAHAMMRSIRLAEDEEQSG